MLQQAAPPRQKKTNKKRKKTKTMLYIALSIVFLAGISITYAYTNSNRRMKDFAGFSNTAMKKALSGELSGKNIREMQEAIETSDRLKRKNMEQKSPGLIPLS